MEEKTEMLHKLCKALTEELEDYSKKIERSDGMSAGDLEAVDKLAHALKSVKTTIAMMDAEGEGYSNRYSRNSYAAEDGSSNRGSNSYEGGNSNARGRMNARRDSMGRYSRESGYSYHDDFRGILEDAMKAAPNSEVREMLHRVMVQM